MTMFILPDKRVVGGGVSNNFQRFRDMDITYDIPLTWEEQQDWACWSDFQGNTGKTLLSEVILLKGVHNQTCARCGEHNNHEEDDYMCIYCRYDLPRSKGMSV